MLGKTLVASFCDACDSEPQVVLGKIFVTGYGDLCDFETKAVLGRPSWLPSATSVTSSSWWCSA